MKEKNNAPWPYKENGQAFIGEGRGAPEVTIKRKLEEKVLPKEQTTRIQ